MNRSETPAAAPPTGLQDRIRANFRETAANIAALCEGPYIDNLARAVDILVDAFRTGHKLLVFGNGGSSSDAQHIAAEFVGRFVRERRGLPAIALTANESILTSVSNDYGFAVVFQRQIEAYGQPGDVAWGISTSGNSPNVVAALKSARAAGLRTIGLTGRGGGQMSSFCDVLLAAPVAETPRIQELHLLTYHSICEMVEEMMADASGRP